MFPIPPAADFSLNNNFDVCTHTAANQGQANNFPIGPFNPPPPLNHGFDVYTETSAENAMPNNFPNGPFNPPPLNNGFDVYNNTQANHGKPNNFPNGPFPNFPPIPNPPVNVAQNPLSSNRGGQYFKTRLCAKYQQGLCAYGQNCTFAHGRHELRFLPTDQQENVGREGLFGNSSGQQKITKRGICRKFYNGEECPYGDGCIFLHQKPLGEMQNSLAKKVKTEANSEQNTGVKVMGSHHLEVNRNATSYGDINETSQRPALWKTRMCIKWETTGYCPFGDKCNFAHGYEELEKSGGYTDVGSVNVAKAPPSPLPDIPGDEGSPTQPDSQPQNEQPNSLLKWERPRKIIGIYGDWID